MLKIDYPRIRMETDRSFMQLLKQSNQEIRLRQDMKCKTGKKENCVILKCILNNKYRFRTQAQFKIFKTLKDTMNLDHSLSSIDGHLGHSLLPVNGSSSPVRRSSLFSCKMGLSLWMSCSSMTVMNVSCDGAFTLFLQNFHL